MKKRFLAAVLTAAMVLSLNLTAFANSWMADANGWWIPESERPGTWLKDDIGWWWQFEDGTYPVSTWLWIDGDNDGKAECYCFNEAGYLYVNTITPDGYEVNAEGQWLRNGYVQSDSAELNAAAKEVYMLLFGTEE